MYFPSSVVLFSQAQFISSYTAFTREINQIYIPRLLGQAFYPAFYGQWQMVGHVTWKVTHKKRHRQIFFFSLVGWFVANTYLSEAVSFPIVTTVSIHIPIFQMQWVLWSRSIICILNNTLGFQVFQFLFINYEFDIIARPRTRSTQVGVPVRDVFIFYAICIL